MRNASEPDFFWKDASRNLVRLDLEKIESLKMGHWMDQARKELKKNGGVFLPGLTDWLETLSPILRADAWKALHDPQVSGILHSIKSQKGHYVLNDDGVIDARPQPSVGFSAKSEKSHLTLVEGADEIAVDSLLPACVQDLLADGFKFLNSLRSYLTEILPPTELPSILRTRIFEYHPSDPLFRLKPQSTCPPGMRWHCDGSVVTVIVADSDRALQRKLDQQGVSISRPNNQSFGLMIPGIAAAHDFDIPPTEHFVVPLNEPRVSVVTVLAPDLGFHNVDQAAERLRKWRLKQTTQRRALGEFRFLSLVRPNTKVAVE